jgi:hypothetical protein
MNTMDYQQQQQDKDEERKEPMPIGSMGGKTRMQKKRMEKRMGKMNKTMKMYHGPGTCCDSTFDGIICWHKRMFEELGWMVLAKERGMSDKVMVYKNSIARLKMAIEQKLADTRDKDRKDDLKVLLHNVCVLMDHANHDF